jgi:hypothetical protein
MIAWTDKVKTITWRTVAEFVGILALVGSLIFVGVQIQLDRRVASSQVNMAALEARIGIEIALAENADVWIKAANLEELSESEKQVVKHLALMSSGKAFFESLSGSRVKGRAGSEIFRETSGVIAGFSTLLFENPGARRIWLEWADRQEAYDKTLRTSDTQRHFFNVVRNQLAVLDEGHKADAFK